MESTEILTLIENFDHDASVLIRDIEKFGDPSKKVRLDGSSLVPTSGQMVKSFQVLNQKILHLLTKMEDLKNSEPWSEIRQSFHQHMISCLQILKHGISKNLLIDHKFRSDLLENLALLTEMPKEFLGMHRRNSLRSANDSDAEKNRLSSDSNLDTQFSELSIQSSQKRDNLVSMDEITSNLLSNETALEKFRSWASYDNSLFIFDAWKDFHDFITSLDSSLGGGNMDAQNFYFTHFSPDGPLFQLVQDNALHDLKVLDFESDDIEMVCTKAEKSLRIFLQKHSIPRFLKSQDGRAVLKKSINQKIQNLMELRIHEFQSIISTDVYISHFPDFLLSMIVSDSQNQQNDSTLYEITLERARDKYKIAGTDKRFQNNKYRPKIYRKFSDFQDLRSALIKYFPREQIPKLQKTPIILRPKHLDSELNRFLAELFDVKQKIVQSAIIREFIKPNMLDLENYDFDRRISKDMKSKTEI